MEVFRYTNARTLERDRGVGYLRPHFLEWGSPIYAFPDSPLRWGARETLEVLSHTQRLSGSSADRLITFTIPETTDVTAYVQEGQLRVWEKSETRRPISEYRRKDYTRPEVVIWGQIPLSIVQELEFPEFLKR